MWASALGIVAAAAVALLLILGLTGSDDQGKHRHKGKHEQAGHESGGGANQGGSPAKPVTVALITRDAMEVCLVTGDGRALIDSQTLISDSKEGPFQPPADHYRLRPHKRGSAHPDPRRPATPPALARAGELRDQRRRRGPTTYKGPRCP